MVTAPTYIFPPSTEDNFLNHLELLNVFSPPECAAIIELGLSLPQVNGAVGNEVVDTTLRRSTVAWIEHKKENAWMWDKLAPLVQMMNKKYYNFNLVGFLECAQFTEYDDIGSHYTWHMDYGSGLLSRRKLSLVVQLTDESEYEGGHLELFYSKEPLRAGKGLGNLIIFPSYTMHRVTPLVSGKRYSLVLWVSGNESYK